MSTMIGTTQDLCVRPAREADATILARLATELGYPAEAADMPSRLARLTGAGHVVLVAERQSEVVGWIQVGATPVLVESPAARILGLVIAAGHRGGGVGRALVAAAETWAAEQGFDRLGVTSNIVRDEAHGFYEHLGYARRKTQHVYSRSIDAATQPPAQPPLDLATRPASLDDVEALVALNAHVQGLHAAAHPRLFKAEPDPHQIREMFAAMLTNPSALWRIAEGDGPLGYVYAQLQDRPATWMRPALSICTIQHLAVRPESRRRGVARRLVADIVAEARARGYARIEIDHWSFNDAARRCFAALGFEVFNERLVLRRYTRM